jgi:hypothetical protein
MSLTSLSADVWGRDVPILAGKPVMVMDSASAGKIHPHAPLG